MNTTAPNDKRQAFSAPRPPHNQARTPALMLLGTSSHVGKSLLTAAFCRYYKNMVAEHLDVETISAELGLPNHLA